MNAIPLTDDFYYRDMKNIKLFAKKGKLLTTSVLLIVMMFSTIKSFSQIGANQYSFSTSNGRYASITPQNTVTFVNSNADDDYANDLSIGFPFTFGSTIYTQFNINTNGYITLGNVANPNKFTTAVGSYNNDFQLLFKTPTIAPLWEDLALTTINSDVTYRNDGAGNSRRLTIQYNNVKWRYTAANASLNFQIILWATGKIQFIYDSISASNITTASASASIGIASASGNFLSLDGTGMNPNASSTVSTNNLSTIPPRNRYYNFDPPPPCSGMPIPGNTLATNTVICANTGASTTLSVQHNEPGFHYQWQSSTNSINGPFRDLSPSDTNATYTYQPNTTLYFQCVVTCLNSGLDSTSTPIEIVYDQSCIIMPDDNTDTTCDAHFFDSGGPTGNYLTNENKKLTLYPSTPGASIQVDFTSFKTENLYDGLMIYNGNSTAAPLISSGLPNGNNATTAPAGSWYGTTSPRIVTSSALDGSLTFVFKSDVIITDSGWKANVTCIPPCDNTPTPGATMATQTFVCAGGTTVLSFPGYFSGVTYLWQSSVDGINWTDIRNATNPTCTTTVTSNTWFRCRLVCTSLSLTGYSDPLLIMSSVCQDIIMPTGGHSITATTCTGHFVDDGSNTTTPGNYLDNDSGFVTIYPGTPGTKVRAIFNSFNTEDRFDGMLIYNGHSVDSPLIRSGLPAGTNAASAPTNSWYGTGGTRSPGIVTSTAIDGALTFRFRSDNTVNRPGWDATVICYSPDGCFGTPMPGRTIASNSLVCFGGRSSLSLQFPTAGNSVTYQWQDATDSLGTNGWHDIPGAITSTYIASAITQVKYYHCIVTCSSQSGTSISTKINIDPSCIIMLPNAFAIDTTCDAHFYDSGGPTDNYGNNESGITVLLPTNSNNIISVDFNSFQLDPSDSLRIYNGVGTAAPLLGTFNSSPGTITSTNVTNGALTFEFISDGVDNSTGWEATVTCTPRTLCTGSPTAQQIDSIQTSQDTVCIGSTTTLSIDNQSLPLGLIYQWKKSIDRGNNYTSISGAINPVYNAVITQDSTYFICEVSCSNAPGTPTITPAKIIRAFVQPVIIDAPNASVCSVIPVTLNAIVSSGNIQWYNSLIGGNIIHIGSPYITPSLTSTTTFYVGSSIGGCSSVRSEVIATLAMVPSPLTISPSNVSFICPTPRITDLTVTGGVYPDGTQAPVTWSPSLYLFRDVNGLIPYYRIGQPLFNTLQVYCNPQVNPNNDTLIYTATAGTTCLTSVSDTLIIRDLNPRVTITRSPAGVLCDSTPVTYTPIPVNGSLSPLTPAYQWYINDTLRNTILSTATSVTFPSVDFPYYIHSGDVVKCVMRPAPNITLCSNAAVISNLDTVFMLPNLKDSVLLTQNNPFCDGRTVKFTASAYSNGGVNPQFEFIRKRGNATFVLQARSTTDTFSTSLLLATNDTVYVKMYPGTTACTAPYPAKSQSIVLTRQPIFTPVFTSPALTTSICLGDTFSLPIFSSNTPPIRGTWSPAINNAQTTTYTYLPDSSYCANSVINQVSVNVSTFPTFVNAPIQSICFGTTPAPSLPTLDDNGIPGTWSPSTMNTTATTLYTFRPTPTPGNCAVLGYMTVVVNPLPTTNIVPIGSVCTNIPANLSAGASSTAGILSYQWQSSLTSGGTFYNISSATNYNYYTDSIKWYKVKVVDSNNCTATSAAYQLIQNSSSPMSGNYTIGAVKAFGVSGVGTKLAYNSALSFGLVIGAVLTKETTGTGALASNTIITNIALDSITVNKAPTLALNGATLSGTTCINFISFKRSVDTINSRSINGDVTFTIPNGYTEKLDTTLILGKGNLASLPTNSIYKINFQRQSTSGANPLLYAYKGTKTAATSNDNLIDGLWALNGVDNVTIDGIDLIDTNTVSSTTMMEYGYALFKTSTTNGAQKNTIKNCNITLNKKNTVLASNTLANPIFNGSIGIAVMNSLITIANAGITPTISTGSNSRNSFYGNTISNCNIGIGLNGFAASSPFNLGDTLNDVGGNNTANGNTINNFGGEGTDEVNGIIANNQWGINISYNTINNITDHNGAIYGINSKNGTSANVTINNNNIDVKSVSAFNDCYGIANSIGNTATNNTVSINNNIVKVNNDAGGAANFYSINNTASVAILNINGNTIQNCTLSGTGEWRAIYNSGTCNTININNNVIQKNNIVSNKVGTLPTAPFAYIYTSTISPNGNVNINNNSIINNKKQAGAISCLYFIHTGNSPTSTVSDISNNSIQNDTVLTGTNTVEVAAINTGTVTVTANNNTINNVGILNNNSNTFTLKFYGIRSLYTNTSNETYSNNTIRKIYLNSNLTFSALSNFITGIYSNTSSSSSTKNIYNNIIDSLFTRSDISCSIYGIENAGSGNILNIYKNKIHSFYSGYKAGVTRVFGILISNLNSNALVNIYNNMIAFDLTKAFSPASTTSMNNTEAIRGIDISANQVGNVNLSYNTIKLAGTGTNNFGATGIYHKTSNPSFTLNLSLRNNIIVNACLFQGLGYVTAFRRSTATSPVSYYNTNSNYNNFYINDSSNTNLVYYDPSNSFKSLSSMRTYFGSPTDANSKTVNPKFVDSATDLHITDTTFANNQLLNGAASPIVGILNDYDNEARDLLTPDIGYDEFNANSFAGHVNYDTSVCYGSKVRLTLESYQGTINGWESSLDSITWTPIPNTSGLVTIIPTITSQPKIYFHALVTSVFTPSATKASLASKVTVYTRPQITGSTSVCKGSTTTLSGATTSSTNNPWQTSVPLVGTVSSGGVVTAVAAGTTNIIFTDNKGCTDTAILTVKPLPTITGSRNVCMGILDTLIGSGTASNPAWTSSNASINIGITNGILSTNTSGKTLITYTDNTGCSVSDSFIVNNNPTIAGVSSPFCIGSSMSLTSSGGAARLNAWTSTASNVASINNNGFMTALSYGSTVVRFTDTLGCYAETSPIKVDSLPYISNTVGGSLITSTNVCIGSDIQLYGSATPAVSPWTSDNIAIATVGASSGLVNGVLDGYCEIGYKNSIGCVRKVMLTVYELPKAYNVNGGGSYCVGSTPPSIGLSNSQRGVTYYLIRTATPADTISFMSGTGASINFAPVAIAGTYSIAAKNDSTTCLMVMSGTKQIVLNQLPQGVFSVTDNNCEPGPGYITFTAAPDSGLNPFTIIYNDGIANRTKVNVRSGISFSPFINPVTTTTVYTLLSVSDSNGCIRITGFTKSIDSIKVKTITITNLTVCDSTRWFDSTYFVSGRYGHSYYNASGCLSYDSLILTVNVGSHQSFSKDTCDYYIWNTPDNRHIFYDSTGTYTSSYTNSAGCQSVDTLHLIIYKCSYNSYVVNACYNYNWHDIIYNTSGTYLHTYLNRYGCQSIDTLYLTVNKLITWTGDVSTDWNDSLNWCGRVPDSSIDVIIPGGRFNYPNIDNSTFPSAKCKKITIASGGHVDITSQGKLSIYDSIKVASSTSNFHAIDGTIELAGNNLPSQPMPANMLLGGYLRNLIINSKKVTLGSSLNLCGKLSFSGSNRKFITNDLLTLKSSDTLTASVGNIFKDQNTGLVISGDSIFGNVVVERYLSKKKAWRILSSPTQHNLQTIKDAWMEGVQNNINPGSGKGIQIISNRSTWNNDGFDTLSRSPSVKLLDVSSPAWYGITSTNSGSFKLGKGYMTFVRGDRSVTSFSDTSHKSTVIREKGKLITGDSIISLGASTSAGQYLAVGNIYASAISLKNITKTNLDSTYYIWDPKLTGLYGYGGYLTVSVNDGILSVAPYDSYINGSYADKDVNIESGQGFLVRTLAVGRPTIKFKESDKVDGSNLVSRVGNNQVSLRTNLYKMENNQPALYDGVLNIYDASASNSIEANDAIKAISNSASISIKSNSELLSIERRKELSDNDTIFYNMAQLGTAKYKLYFTPENLNTPGLQGYLEDFYLHSITPVSLTDNTSVDFEVNADSASYQVNRFRLIFKVASPLPVTFVQVAATKKDKNILVSWKVENEININKYLIEKSGDGIHFSSIGEKQSNKVLDYNWLDENPFCGNNFYRIKSVGYSGDVKLSKVVKVVVEISSLISMYPNPIKQDKIVHLKISNLPEGQFNVKLINDLGQVIMKNSIMHKVGTSDYKFKLNDNVLHGHYLMEIIDSKSMKTVLNLIY